MRVKSFYRKITGKNKLEHKRAKSAANSWHVS